MTTLLHHYFELFDLNKLSIPRIEDKSEAEKAIAEFLKIEDFKAIPSDSLSKQLDEIITKIDRYSVNVEILDPLKCYNEYLNNKSAINMLLKVILPLSSFPEEIKNRFQELLAKLLARNELLVTATLEFFEKRLPEITQNAAKLLENIEPSNAKGWDNWSKATDALYERINKINNLEKVWIALVKENRVNIEKIWNVSNKKSTSNEDSPPHPGNK